VSALWPWQVEALVAARWLPLQCLPVHQPAAAAPIGLVGWPEGDCRCGACCDMAQFYGDDARGQLLALKVRRSGWAGSIAPFERAWLRAHPPRWWATRSQNGRRSVPEGLGARFGREVAPEAIPV
jgi:hypothetical protein